MALGLIAVAAAIIVIALIFLLAHQRTTGVLSQNLHTVFWYFDVGREYNMATWYNSGLWLLMGVLSAVIALARPVAPPCLVAAHGGLAVRLGGRVPRCA